MIKNRQINHDLKKKILTDSHKCYLCISSVDLWNHWQTYLLYCSMNKKREDNVKIKYIKHYKMYTWKIKDCKYIHEHFQRDW